MPGDILAETSWRPDREAGAHRGVSTIRMGGPRQFVMDEIRRRYRSQRVVTRSAYPMEEADA
ncbi:MAG: hypothetical protein M1570_00800 [Chloroflexi bacterium]|nr:hypothetical protein [Chloroflexota bacterium]